MSLQDPHSYLSLHSGPCPTEVLTYLLETPIWGLPVVHTQTPLPAWGCLLLRTGVLLSAPVVCWSSWKSWTQQKPGYKMQRHRCDPGSTWKGWKPARAQPDGQLSGRKKSGGWLKSRLKYPNHPVPRPLSSCLCSTRLRPNYLFLRPGFHTFVDSAWSNYESSFCPNSSPQLLADRETDPTGFAAA